MSYGFSGSGGMGCSRPTTPELTKELNIPKDVASAMRKSLSYDFLNVPGGDEQASPIGTPTTATAEDGADGLESETGDGPRAADEGGKGEFADYQLWHHHRGSDVGVAKSQSSTYESLLEVMLGWDFSGKQTGGDKGAPRGSSEEALAVRQWLNPRSSFSAASTNEPELCLTASRKSSLMTLSRSASSAFERKCWITVCTSLADMQPILALRKSLQNIQSKYRLLVLYDAEQSDVAECLVSHDFYTLGITPLAPRLSAELASDGTLLPRWLLLAAWHELNGAYDDVCYLSPYLLAVASIDELLDFNDEIDNETCTLVVNRTRIPSVITFKPHNEIRMVFDEYLTVYGADLEKLEKLRGLSDWGILSELFSESCHRLSDRYGVDVGDDSLPVMRGVKVLDFGHVKPWLHAADDKNAYVRLWWSFWDNGTV
ncbi:ACR246Wp [Eremothecium gossypii ATCC 10895]|uniref:ACR246Wp n=1 Tax=Eremothecium gossypii (strain ATCC 10895 / CBS 109.51 / FGSC 9923 / NRRL Y-1056) TaxID=284811 RepID=Q75BM5_EREGS|nr:ACR246Wp [Eremothecium gossypii ATCC 10895]AAS51472.1 ACR246Wp [Eremothecium gossypii ATCC 10895]AEY95763.1 FACR246Wp [Eremothecium gossypii FDAG1]